MHKLDNDPRGVAVVKEVTMTKPDHNMNCIDSKACHRMIMNPSSSHGDGEAYWKRDRL